MAQVFFVKKRAQTQEEYIANVFFYEELSFSYLFKSVLQSSASEIFLHISKDNFKTHMAVISGLKAHYPELAINFYTDDCLLSEFQTTLKTNILISCCFGVSEELFLSLVNSPSELLKLKHVHFSDGKFSYAEKNSNSNTESETLIVLMPAWNNFFPPFGIAHLAGALDKINASYDILDLNNLFYNQVLKRSGENGKYSNLIYWQNEALYQQSTSVDLQFVFDALFAKITNKTRFVGFSLFGTTLLASQQAMSLIRLHHPQIKIFCGGPHGTIAVIKSLIEKNLIDAAVMGEGEESLTELIQIWQSSHDVKDVAGVILNHNGQMQIGPNRQLMDINHLPKPNFGKFPLFQYERNMTLPIYSSRGCVAKCSFCSETIYWKKFRAVSPENIVAMMEHNIKNYGINTFYFNDSLMNGSHKLLGEMCDLIIEKKLVVKFEGYSRFDHKLTPELLEKMANAGCILMLFGFESGSQKVIDLMNKNVFVENYELILKRASAVGIACQVCIIVGFPGETWLDFFSTLKKVLKVRQYIAGLNLSIMEISRNSLIEKDFEKYNIVNAQNRYWRTKNWTNFFLLRLVRYLVFKYVWRLYSGKGVSTSSWNPGYLMIYKKLMAWVRLRYLRNSHVS